MDIEEICWGVPVAQREGVVALGSFDGLNLEDLRVIDATKKVAETSLGRACVLLFEPHPRRLLRPKDAPFNLMTTDQRHRKLRAHNVDYLYRGMFAPEISNLTASEFVKRVVHDTLGAKQVCASSRIQFGRSETDRQAFLSALRAAYGPAFTIIEPERDGDDNFINSNAIRLALQQGNVREATRQLGRHFAIEGPVMHGAKLGRTIGFPTANIPLGEYIRPAFGIYASYIRLASGRRLPSVSYIGRRPTVGGVEELLEVFLLDFNENLYGQTVETELVDFIRPDQSFSGLEELKMQIALDSDSARQILHDQP